MKRIQTLAALLGVLALATSHPAFAREGEAVTIQSTGTSATNGTSFATTFGIPAGSSLPALIQCDAAAYYLAVSSSSGAVTSSTGTKVSADVAWPITIDYAYPFIAVISVSGTVNCKVIPVY